MFAVFSARTVTLLLAAAAYTADEPVVLQYKIQADKPLIYQNVTTAKSQQTVNNVEIATEFSTTDVSLYKLQTANEGGNFDLQKENKQLKVHLKVDPVGEYTFDSKSTERDTASLFGSIIGPFYDRLSGAVIGLTISPRGELLEVKGYEELVGDLLKENPALAQFGGTNNDGARQTLSDQLVYLSDKPAKPGDTWERPYALNLTKLGKVTGKQVYKYEGPDKVGETPTARISITTQIDFDLDLEANGAKVTGRLSTGNSSGTVHFDAERGCLLTKELTFSLGGNLTIAVEGNQLPIQVNQTQAVKVTLLDKLPE